MTASEQRLALLLGGVVIAGGAFVGLTSLKAWKLRVDARALSVESRRLEADTLLAEKDFWRQRSAWLLERQPVFTRRGEADNGFLELLQSTASAEGVQLTQTQPVEPAERAGLISSSFTIEARGEWEAVNQWLHRLQKPDAYLSIPALSVTPNDADTSQVIVNMNVQKWFRLPPS